jgi:nickel-dependent lactate racemase
VPQYTFPYGSETLSFSLPPGLDVTEAFLRPMAPLPNLMESFHQTLEKSIGRPPLDTVANGMSECMVLVSDHSRRNAYQLWLPELLNRLNAAGLPDGKIRLYVASALRPAMTQAEKLEYFGAEICRRVEIMDHDCDSPTLLKIGRTDYGTVLYIDPRVYNSDMLILTGGIRYHSFSGYTGGRDTILPGVCGRESNNSNFKRGIDPKTDDLARGVEPGRMMGNPISEDMHEACNLAKPNYYVDVVLNDEGEVAWIGAGDYGYVPRVGAKFLDDHNRFTVPRLAEVAIVGSGGGRNDETLYRAHKALRQASPGLAPGCAVIWVAKCPGGEGPSILADWRDLSIEECAHKVLYQGSQMGLTAFSLKKMARDFSLHMVGDLDPEVAKAWGITMHDTVERALGRALSAAPQKAHWLIAPNLNNGLVQKAADEAVEA